MMFRYRNLFIIQVLCCFLILINFNISNAQQIITNGNTNTSLNINGYITNVSTSTIKGSNAFNSFSRFNVEEYNIVNLIVPGSSENLLNLVHDEATQIDGILNSIKNNQIDGNIFLINPFGIYVNRYGSINTGSLTAITPTTGFMDSFFTAPGVVDDYSVETVLAGNTPINHMGVISINGQINAIDSVRLDTGELNVGLSGGINTGFYSRYAIEEIEDVLNINDVEEAEEMVNNDGKIVLKSFYDINHWGDIFSDNASVEFIANESIEGNGTINTNSNINLTAKYGSIGDLYAYLNVNEGDKSGLLTVKAYNNIYLNELSGDMRVNLIESTTEGNIYLSVRDGSIIDATNSDQVNIIGNNLTIGKPKTYYFIGINGLENQAQGFYTYYKNFLKRYGKNWAEMPESNFTIFDYNDFTKEDIIKTIQKYSYRLNDNDMLFINYCGHGGGGGDPDKPYDNNHDLGIDDIPYDENNGIALDVGDEFMGFEQGFHITDDEFALSLSGSKGLVFYATDACHSGGMFGGDADLDAIANKNGFKFFGMTGSREGRYGFGPDDEPYITETGEAFTFIGDLNIALLDSITKDNPVFNCFDAEGKEVSYELTNPFNIDDQVLLNDWYNAIDKGDYYQSDGETVLPEDFLSFTNMSEQDIINNPVLYRKTWTPLDNNEPVKGVGNNNNAINVTLAGNINIISDLSVNLEGSVEGTTNIRSINGGVNIDGNFTNTLNIASKQNIRINQPLSDVKIETIITDADAIINAKGNILNANTLTPEIKANNITLSSESGTIGSQYSFINIDENDVSGVINAKAYNNIYLNELYGDMRLGLIESTGNKDIYLSTYDGSIINALNTSSTNVIGRNLYAFKPQNFYFMSMFGIDSDKDKEFLPYYYDVLTQNASNWKNTTYYKHFVDMNYTKSDVINALTNVSNRLNENDMFLITYLGHGGGGGDPDKSYEDNHDIGTDYYPYDENNGIALDIGDEYLAFEQKFSITDDEFAYALSNSKGTISYFSCQCHGGGMFGGDADLDAVANKNGFNYYGITGNIEGRYAFGQMYFAVDGRDYHFVPTLMTSMIDIFVKKNPTLYTRNSSGLPVTYALNNPTSMDGNVYLDNYFNAIHKATYYRRFGTNSDIKVFSYKDISSNNIDPIYKEEFSSYTNMNSEEIANNPLMTSDNWSPFDKILPVKGVGNNNPVNVNLTGNVEIASTGSVNISGKIAGNASVISNNGTISINQTSGDLLINSITTSGNVNLTAEGNITDGISNDIGNILGNNINLISYNGSIGTNQNSIDLSSNRLSATANNLINLSEYSSNMNLGQISSKRGNVKLTSVNGNINSALSVNEVNIKAIDTELYASKGYIGTTSRPILMDLIACNLDSKALGNINISESNGDLYINLVESKTGDVSLKTFNGSLLDGTASHDPNIKAYNVNLVANNGSIGTMTDNIIIDASGNIYTKADKGVYINNKNIEKAIDDDIARVNNTYEELFIRYEDYFTEEEFESIKYTDIKIIENIDLLKPENELFVLMIVFQASQVYEEALKDNKTESEALEESKAFLKQQNIDSNVSKELLKRDLIKSNALYSQLLNSITG